MVKDVQKECDRYKDTIKESLQLEDYEEEGFLSRDLFIENLKTLELNLTKDQLDFLVFAMYLKSESLSKLKYGFFSDMLDGKYTPVVAGGTSSSNEGGNLRKRPESSSPEKLKARNKSKFE